MKTYHLILLLILPFFAHTQFYYNDLLGATDLEMQMQTLLEQKVTSVTAIGYDENGTKSRDFNEWQQVDANSHTWRRQSRNGMNISRQAFRFDPDGQLLSIADSAAGITSLTDYKYDQQDRLIEIVTEVKDSAQDFSKSESHQWQYLENGNPTRLLKIVDGKDTTEYRFKVDEKGRVIEEQLFRRNTGFDIVYYYYNSSDQLTDIVRYNKRVNKLLPDFMFEFDESGRVVQKIATVSTRTSNYIIWRYAFNEKGLKIREALFNKQKEMTGRIDYQYNYLP